MLGITPPSAAPAGPVPSSEHGLLLHRVLVRRKGTLGGSRGKWEEPCVPGRTRKEEAAGTDNTRWRQEDHAGAASAIRPGAQTVLSHIPCPTEPAVRATAARTQMQLSPARVWAWGQDFQKQQDSSQYFSMLFNKDPEC